MAKRTITPILSLVLVLGFALVGMLLLIPKETAAALSRILYTFEFTAHGLIVAAGVAGGLGLLAGLGYLVAAGWFTGSALRSTAQKRDAEARLMAAEARKKEAEAIQIERLSEILVIKGGFDEQIIIRDLLTGAIRNLTLDPRPYINGLQSEPTDEQASRWFYAHGVHAKKPELKSLGPGQQAAQLAAGLPPILSVLSNKDTIMLFGPRGSGKTNILKHLVALKLATHAIVLIDSHTPSKICGFDTIGAGQDWAAIESTLRSIEQMGRFRLRHPGQHRPLFVFIDEWRNIVRNVDGANEILITIVHEFRKAQIDIALASQSKSVKALGIEGEGDLRDTFTLVACEGYEGHDHRAFILPNQVLDRLGGKRPQPVEYAPPPPFTGQVIEPAQIFRLPAPKSREQLRAEELKAEGLTVTAIARELFGVDKATGRQIDEVKRMLGEEVT